ncbi:MAG: hypothetical protein ACSW8G_02570 [Bacillota bacterium]
MGKKLKMCLALFLALAVVAQYSFSSQALVAYGLDNTGGAVQTEQSEGDDGQASGGQETTEPTTEAATETPDPVETDSPAETTDATETEETPEPEELEEEEISYPAVQFTKTAGGMTVSISAPEGALPEGATVVVKGVKTESIQGAVEKLIENAEVVKAVDITFYDKDGKEIEPAKKVSVAFASNDFRKLDNAQVIHIKDSGAAEKVSGSSVNGKTAAFKSDDFSIYAVIDQKIVTVNFYDGNGELITSENIKKNPDGVEDLYEPSFTVEKGEGFFGWAATEGASTGQTIDQLNAAIESNWDNIGSTLDYYAVIKKVYVVTFNKYDEDGKLVSGNQILEGEGSFLGKQVIHRDIRREASLCEIY